ncbi:MAG TPA: hypothetical protein DEB56_07125 [Thiobacillus sp.]|nr:hypothetical protein [Thiobacillus sp.]
MPKLPKVQVEITALDKASAAIKGFAARTKIALAPIETIGKAAGSALRGIGILAAGATAAGYAVSRFLDDYVERSSELYNLSRQLGINAVALQELRFAAGQTDTGVDTLDNSLKIFSRTMGQLKAGKGPLAALLKDVGPGRLAMLQGAKGTEEAFDLVMQAISDLEDPTRRAALAQAAFGRGGGDMIRMVEAGADGLKNLRKEAHLYGIQTEADLKAAEEFGDTMSKLKSMLRGVANVLGKELVPLLEPLVKQTIAWMQANREAIGTKIREGLQTVVGLLQFVADHWKAIRNIILVVAGVNVLGKVVGSLNSILDLASKIGPAMKAWGAGGVPGLPPVLGPNGVPIPGAGKMGVLEKITTRVLPAIIGYEIGKPIGEIIGETLADMKEIDQEELETRARISDVGARRMAARNAVLSRMPNMAGIPGWASLMDKPLVIRVEGSGLPAGTNISVPDSPPGVTVQLTQFKRMWGFAQ